MKSKKIRSGKASKISARKTDFIDGCESVFTKDQRPLVAMTGIILAAHKGVPITKNIATYLIDSLELFVAGKGELTLDKCFGATDNEGPNSIFRLSEINKRNLILYSSVKLLASLGLSQPLAIRLALAEAGNPITPKTLANVISAGGLESSAKICPGQETAYLKDFLIYDITPNDRSKLKSKIAELAKVQARAELDSL